MPPYGYGEGNNHFDATPEDIPEESNEMINERNFETVNKANDFKLQIVWRNVIIFVILHSIGVYGIYLTFARAKLATVIFSIILYHMGGLGITMGAHRLWSHRSFKATTPLKLILLFWNTLAHQNSVIEWSRDHRVHHKFQETNADPHNISRGFFFSHMGWLVCKKHPDVKTKGKTIDLTDLQADPLLRFQKKYFIPLMILICFVFPTVVPMFIWNETFMNAYCINVLRYLCTLHATWLVNSAAHIWGNKPYDKFNNSTQVAYVSLFAGGEGWHNYHHAFPWDYKAAEFGWLNETMLFIHMFAKIGWAYDLKSVPKEMIKNRVYRTGDGTHEIWGWGDKDQTPENFNSAVITNRKHE